MKLNLLSTEKAFVNYFKNKRRHCIARIKNVESKQKIINKSLNQKMALFFMRE